MTSTTNVSISIIIVFDSKNSEKNDLDQISLTFYKIIDTTLDNFLHSKDTSEESFYFAIKFFNNVMSNKYHRSEFINYAIMMKVIKFFNSKKLEVKKDIAKFLQSIA